MPRQLRVNLGDTIYHVINRANARVPIFNTDKDYQLFEGLLREAKELVGMRVLAYCVMPNHWHLVLYPKKSGDLSEYMKWLTNSHTRIYHVQHKTIGFGHLYQGRYKSFMVQTDPYALQVLKYVEQNPLRAKLVTKAEDWQWSSLWRREQGSNVQKQLLSEWPVETPHNYNAWVNELEDDELLEVMRISVNKGKPFGRSNWVGDTIERHRLQSTTRSSGRPKNK